MGTKVGRISSELLSTKMSLAQHKTAQQSVHPTLGSLAKSQAFFYASAFFQSDGVPPPAPARVTQTVGRLPSKIMSSSLKEKHNLDFVAKSKTEKPSSFSSKVSGLHNSVFGRGVSSNLLSSQVIAL